MRVSRRSQRKDRGAGGFRAKSSKYFLGPGISFFRELFLVPASREGGALRAPPLSLSTGAAPDLFSPCTPSLYHFFPVVCRSRSTFESFACVRKISRSLKIFECLIVVILPVLNFRTMQNWAPRRRGLENRKFRSAAACLPGRFAPIFVPHGVRPQGRRAFFFFPLSTTVRDCTPFFVNTGELGRSCVFPVFSLVSRPGFRIFRGESGFFPPRR